MADKKVPTMEDLIADKNTNATNKPGILEALLSTVDSIFTRKGKLQKARVNARQVRGIVKVIGGQTYLRKVFSEYEGEEFEPFLNEESGEFTYSKYDNPILTAIAEGVLTSRISLDGKSREEMIRMFQAVGSAAHEEEQKKNGILSRFDY